MGSGTEGILYNGSVWRNPNDNRYVPALYSDSDERNLNLNLFDSEWNPNYRFVGLRYFLHSSAFKRKFSSLISVFASLPAFFLSH